MSIMQGLPSLAENALAKRPPMPPPQGSPLPYDLAQMLAKQKVLKEAVDAQAHQMMQQAAGQGKPPTVDMSLNEKLSQLFKPPQQQAGPDLQQAAMGPGMNNQGAAPPNSPPPGGGAPMPQQPPGPVQGMAAGGLASLPTNLPQSYAGGGIIAFAHGKEVDTPEMYAGDAMKGVSAKAKESKDTSDMSPFESLVEKLGIKGAIAAIANRHSEMTGMGAAQPAPSTPDAPGLSPEETATLQSAIAQGPKDSILRAPTSAAPPAPPTAPKPEGLPAAANNDSGSGSGSGSVRVSARGPVGGNAPEMLALPPEDAAFRKDTRKGITDLVHTNPEQVRRDKMAEAQNAYGGMEAAMRARQAQDIQAQRDANAEQLKQNDPNTWGRWMSRFDPHSRFLGEGVAAKTYAAQDAQQEMKQKQLAGLRALQDAQESGAIGDVKSQFTLGDAARKEAEGVRKDALTNATSMVDTDQKALSTKQASLDAYQGRVQAAQIAAAARADAKAAGADNKQLQMLNKSQSDAMRYAELQAAAQSKTLGGMETDIPALTLKLYNKALNEDRVYQKIMGDLKIPQITAPTGSKLSPADQALVNKYGK